MPARCSQMLIRFTALARETMPAMHVVKVLAQSEGAGLPVVREGNVV
jgi:hypothetical protein